MSAPEKITVSDLSRSELEALTERLLAENATLKQAVADLRAEMARLKGLKGRPAFKPSGMEPATNPKPAGQARKRGPKARKTERLAIQEECILKAEVPAGSRFSRASRAMRIMSSRIWCCARMWCGFAASVGRRRTVGP